MTDKSKHTPGEWRVGGVYNGTEEDRRVITADDGTKYHRRRVLARVLTPQGYADTHPEIEANARLIAAAPALLAACEQLLPVARQYLAPVYGNALEFAIRAATEEQGVTG